MPRDGRGTFVRTDGTRQGPTLFQEQQSTVRTINAPLLDHHANDIADAITGSVPRDGQAGMEANLPMGSNRITGVGNAVDRTDVPSYDQLLGLVFPFVEPTSVGGTADAIALAPDPELVAYELGRTGYRFIAKAENTAAVTVAVSGLAPQALRRADGSAMESGDITIGRHLTIVFDGNRFLSDIEPPSGLSGTLSVDRGGTGAEDADGARTNLGVGTLGTKTYWHGTVAQYNALARKDNNTVYFARN